MLQGVYGEAKALAMKLLVAVGDIFEAKRMIKVKSVQVSGVSYKTIGEAGLEFLEDLCRKGAEATVKTTLNPAGMDLTEWRRMRIPSDFARKQLRIISAFKRMRMNITCTCIPYFVGNRPGFGESVAWAESSAISFANSVLGARTNREGGPTALASSITGRTPLYGLHLDENRRPTHIVQVQTELRTDLDFSLLGYALGRKLGYCVPFITGTSMERNFDHLKTLGASMATSGAIALYHIGGITAESHLIIKEHDLHFLEKISIGKTALRSVREKLTFAESPKHVCLGCPHCSLKELGKVAKLVDGKRLKRKLWCFTSRETCEEAEKLGYVSAIGGAGGLVVKDTCMVVSPLEKIGVDQILTNSCKAAHYLPSLSRVRVALAPLEECVRFAVEGS